MKPKMVFILWYSDGRDRWIEGVYYDKDLAEVHLRSLKKLDADGGTSSCYHYWIQEKAVTQ